jgi:hypothetical protein
VLGYSTRYIPRSRIAFQDSESSSPPYSDQMNNKKKKKKKVQQFRKILTDLFLAMCLNKSSLLSFTSLLQVYDRRLQNPGWRHLSHSLVLHILPKRSSSSTKKKESCKYCSMNIFQKYPPYIRPIRQNITQRHRYSNRNPQWISYNTKTP